MFVLCNSNFCDFISFACVYIFFLQLAYNFSHILGSFNKYIHSFRSLLNDLARIEQDLGVKVNSLQLDESCMKTRERLTVKPDEVAPGVEGVPGGVDGLQVEVRVQGNRAIT